MPSHFPLSFRSPSNPYPTSPLGRGLPLPISLPVDLEPPPRGSSAASFSALWRFWSRSFFGSHFYHLFDALLDPNWAPIFLSWPTLGRSKIGTNFGPPPNTITIDFQAIFRPPFRPFFRPRLLQNGHCHRKRSNAGNLINIMV